MTYIKVEGKNQLYRDTYSNGIVNDNKTEYYNYINEYKNKIKYENRIKDIENDIGQVKNDLNEIKELLRNLSK